MQFSTCDTKRETPSHTIVCLMSENQHVVLSCCKHLGMNIIRVLTVGTTMEGRSAPSLLGSQNILGIVASSFARKIFSQNC